VLVQVVDEMTQVGNSGHAGATVNLEPASRVYYTGQQFFPDPNAAMTSTAARYIFNPVMTDTIVTLGGNATGDGALDLKNVNGGGGAHYFHSWPRRPPEALASGHSWNTTRQTCGT